MRVLAHTGLPIPNCLERFAQALLPAVLPGPGDAEMSIPPRQMMVSA